jgi:hypothetical protein
VSGCRSSSEMAVDEQLSRSHVPDLVGIPDRVLTYVSVAGVRAA